MPLTQMQLVAVASMLYREAITGFIVSPLDGVAKVFVGDLCEIARISRDGKISRS